LSLYTSTIGKFSRDLGIDLGTANTLVFAKGKGIILSEPSVVAVKKNNNKVLAIGKEAKKMVGRTHGGVVAIRPMKSGVIADFEITEAMIRSFINMAIKHPFFIKPRIIIGIPSGITTVERRAVVDAATKAGAKETFLIEEPMAAAIGSDISIFEPQGNLIIDIGGGTTEVAIISLGGIVISCSIRVAGDEMDQAIISHCRRNYNLLVGERTAEQVKIEIGSAFPMKTEKSMEVRGRDLISGLPKNFTLTSAEIRDALSEPINTITDAIIMTLEKTPPELSSDIMSKGLVMTGGGSLLKGLNKYINHETDIPVTVANDPLSSVAYGTGYVVKDFSKYKKILISSKNI